MVGARICSLLAKLKFRKNITTYPTECSSWAEGKGCTRVSIYADQCVNWQNIDYVNTFNTSQAAALNGKIAECMSKSVTAKI